MPSKKAKFVQEKMRRLLCALQDQVRDEIVASRRKEARNFAKIAAVTKADTIYKIDKISEATILSWFEENWPKEFPVQLVMEGIEDEDCVTFPGGTAVVETKWKCILDPIDGTRCLMYDKRSAWSLGAIAMQKGPSTNLQDIVVAAMTELPTTKQSRSDQFSACSGGKLIARSKFSGSRATKPLSVHPSAATDFKHGFASFVRFFPEGRLLTSKLEEAIWSELYPAEPGETPIIFDDQYISTGGQLHELLSGRDRLVADLRPLILQKLGLKEALVCHPYDICTAFLLEAAGGVIEQPNGQPLDAPLDTTSPVAWIGYANPALAKHFRPALEKAIRRYLC